MAGTVDKQEAVEPGLPADFPAVPKILVFAVEQLGRRPRPDQVRTVIQALCDWRPLRMVEIAALLRRNPPYISTNYLRPMLRDKELEYPHPADLRHPQQAHWVPGGKTVRQGPAAAEEP